MSDLEAAPFTNQPELSGERPAQLDLPGFELLPKERQQAFLRIPPSHLDASRPIIEAEIAASREKLGEKRDGQAEASEGKTALSKARSREAGADEAIETFRRAERGDAQARRDLLDQKKELFGEEPSDDEIIQTMLETESSDPFAEDQLLEVALTDPEAEITQKVLDLFQDHRGSLASIDDAISPKQQIAFFAILTEGQGSLQQRFHFAEKALEWLMSGGADNLQQAFRSQDLLNGTALNKDGVERLKTLVLRSLADTSTAALQEAADTKRAA